MNLIQENAEIDEDRPKASPQKLQKTIADAGDQIMILAEDIGRLIHDTDGQGLSELLLKATAIRKMCRYWQDYLAEIESDLPEDPKYVSTRQLVRDDLVLLHNQISIVDSLIRTYREHIKIRNIAEQNEKET